VIACHVRAICALMLPSISLVELQCFHKIGSCPTDSSDYARLSQRLDTAVCVGSHTSRCVSCGSFHG